MNNQANTREERIIILRDKAAREDIDVPDEVIAYIAEKYSVPQALKGALINVSAYALRRHVPVDMDIARHVLDGIRFPVQKPAETSDEHPSVVGDGPAAAAAAESGAAPAATAESEATPAATAPAAAAPAAPAAATATLEPEPAPSTLFSDDFAEPEIDTIDPARNEFDAPGFTRGAKPFTAWGDEEDLNADEVLFEVEDIAESYEGILDSAEISESEPDLFDDDLAEAYDTSTPASAPITPAPAPAHATSRLASEGPSDVWFVPMHTEHKKSLIERVGNATMRAGLREIISEGDRVAIKVHFGEQGNTAFVSPIYVREIVRLVKECGGKPFLTDANTLYSGMRHNTVDHITCALQNGFSYATVEAPIIIADGLDGHEGVSVPVPGKHFDEVKIGAAAVHADAMVVISHVKGHGEAGFGGAIKNVGMGLGTPAAKQQMHSVVTPHVDQEKCTSCGQCVAWCPEQCIERRPNNRNKAYIHADRCIGCGECVAACSYGAIAIEWENDAEEFQERIVEHVYGALENKREKSLFINFLTDITPECDCWSFSDASIVPDLGVLASTDIVAIEQASLDIVKRAVGLAHTAGEGMLSGVEKFHELHHIDGGIAIRYAHEMGLGSLEYSLKRIG